MKRIIIGLMLLVGILGAEQIGSVTTSGFMFKDKLNIVVFDDPYIHGVSCYVTMPSKTMSFEDQTNSAISCRQVGDISGDIKSQRHIFTKSKSVFFKHLSMDRIYDKKRNVLVYFSYTEKLSGENASSSISVVPLSKLN